MKRLWAELKRRNVIRVGLAYVIGAWLVLQVGDVLVGLLSLPDWSLRLIALVLLLGLPVVLAFAWVYELTPEGVRRAAKVDPTHSITGETGSRLNLLTFVLALGLIGFVLIDRFVLERQPVAGALDEAPAPQVSSKDPRPSIAVLPFANRSSVDEDRFFVDGMHDEVLTNLALIENLKVISRTSVMRYRDTELSLPDIARALDVATVLEGGVQRAGDRIRINVQLIRADSDEHLWAQNYDRELSAENLFEIQSEIATSIAAALKAELTESEQARIETVPTRNFEAYQAYLRGRELFLNRGEGDGQVKLLEALEHLQRAVALEPDYAEAWATLAGVAGVLPGYQDQPDLGYHELALGYAKTALALDDQLALAWGNLALYEGSNNADMVTALRYARRAVELEPNDSTFLLWRGILEALRGEIALADDLVQGALDLDPSSGLITAWAGQLALMAGDEQRGIRLLETAASYRNVFALMLLAAFETERGNHARALELVARAPHPTLAEAWGEKVSDAFINKQSAAVTAEFLLEARQQARYLDHAAVYLLQALGEFDAVLSLLRDNLQSETDLVVITYFPQGAGLRRTEGYRDLLRQVGLPQAWRELGWPEFCRPLEGDDFVCE